MRRSCFVTGILVFFSLFLLITHRAFSDQMESPKASMPPIGQEMVREGAFAVKLADALGVAAVENEREAESKLGRLGIAPRNGWIADYPVTPDILAELRSSVLAAADANKLKFSRDEALLKLERVNSDFNLGIRPYTEGEGPPKEQSKLEEYPNPADINDYYNEQGPPVITYYTPPEQYYSMYSWVPAPFWWFDFRFPGYFILNDFHRVVRTGHHRPGFISNHYNDTTRRRMYRIDPVERFRGHTYGGIGAPRRHGLWKTGVPHSDRKIFHAPRPAVPRSDIRRGAPPARHGTIGTPPRSAAPSTPHGGMKSAPGSGGVSRGFQGR